jgi:ArsR family transcriptional regulator, arsenate/arsenite/antimonite-responsive transcriptional repressor / arsenate reductase (thioredoxin)
MGVFGDRNGASTSGKAIEASEPVRQTAFDSRSSGATRYARCAPSSPERIHWSIADPALEGATDEEGYPVFQRTAAEIETRVQSLLYVIRKLPARR